MEDSPKPDLGPDSNIKRYTILADGSIQAIGEAAKATTNPSDGSTSSDELLYLVEGLSKSTITELGKLLPSLSDVFISAHLCDNLAQVDSTLDENHVFLAKWSRAAAQGSDVWRREKRLRTANSPFNVDDNDPAASRLDHERFDHITEPYRSYNPIYEFEMDAPLNRDIVKGDSRITTTAAEEPCQTADVEAQQNALEGKEGPTVAEPEWPRKIYIQDMVMHAAQECISFYYGNSGDRMIGIIIFDQPRQYRITDVHYNLMTGGEVESEQWSPQRVFQDDGSYLERFLSKIKIANLAPASGNKTAEAAIDTIIAIVLEDQRKLLASISKGLDEIELSMGTDSETIAYFLSTVAEFSAASPFSSRTPTRDQILKRAEKQIEASMRRLEGTYQVLMSSMSILESERAIGQAEVVTRLTNLAFFFIPLTFVSGLFGMNVVEFDQRLTVVMWVAVSLGVTAAAYFIRFRRPLAMAVYQTPQTIRRMRWDRLAARMRRWAQVLRSLAFHLAPFVFLAVVGVAVWIAATLPATDEAKIGITASFPVVTQLLEPGYIVSNKLRRLRPIQQVFKAALYAGAGVALWAVATSALPIDTRIGIALVVLRLPVIVTLTWSHSIPRGRIGSDAWCYLTPKRRFQLPAHALWFDATRAAIVSGLGVTLWKLFTSDLSDTAKIGVAVGAMGIPLMLLGMLFILSEFVRDLDSKNIFRTITIVSWGGVLGFLPIQAMAVWKVSTASSLSISAKLGIGVTLHIGLFSFTFLRRTASLESREYDRGRREMLQTPIFRA